MLNKKIKQILLIITLIIAIFNSAFIYQVKADADKIGLQSSYDNLNTIINTQNNSDPLNPYYEENSYQAFISIINTLGGLIGIQAVLDDTNALQVDVDNLKDSIDNAILGLTLNSTYNLIFANWTNAKNLDTSIYTPISTQLYIEELDRLKVIIDNPTSGEIIITGVDALITNAFNLLVLKADKVDLIALNNQMIDAYFKDINLYTELSHNLYKTDIELLGGYLYVNSVILDENVSQAIVDNLVDKIEQALSLLVRLMDNTNLLEIHYNLNNTDISEYTPDSQNLFIEELNRLYDLTISRNLDETLVNQIYDGYSNITDLLVPLADYTELQELYNQSLNYHEEDYSISSYRFLLDTQAYVLTVLQDLNSTQETISEAKDLLNDSILELSSEIETIYLKQDETINVNQFITLGKSTITNYYIDDSLVIDIDEDGNVIGLQYGEANVFIYLSNGALEKIHVFVQAKPTIGVYILTFSVPVVGIGMGFSVIYFRKSNINKMFNVIKKIIKK